jgi:hypothetical protein
MAIRLCRKSVADIDALPIRETSELSWAGRLPIPTPNRSQTAVSLYLRRHRAATAHAIQVALKAGADDEGAMQLAESPGVDADLLALKAELLRMALELSQGTNLTPALGSN